jgi:hypothetical protein
MLAVMFRSVTLTLGDAFNRRKKLAADLQSWTSRLGLAGAEHAYHSPSRCFRRNAQRVMRHLSTVPSKR